MLLRIEKYVTESGEKRTKEIYGTDEDHVYATIDSSDECMNVEPMPELLTESEERFMNIEAQLEYLSCLAELGGGTESVLVDGLEGSKPSKLGAEDSV